jgi:hypothetical protein
MPKKSSSRLVDYVVKTVKMPKKKVEELWDKASKRAKEEYKIGEKSKKFYPIKVGIFKKSLGKDKLGKLGWSTACVRIPLSAVKSRLWNIKS